MNVEPNSTIKASSYNEDFSEDHIKSPIPHPTNDVGLLTHSACPNGTVDNTIWGPTSDKPRIRMDLGSDTMRRNGT